MIIHSYLYYHLDQPIVSDDKWQSWANELVDLHKEYGLEYRFYDESFYEWDGSTGCHLPNNEWVINKANQLLKEFNNE